MTIFDESRQTGEFYKQLPKVELHRHLEGSLRFATIQELGSDPALKLPLGTHLSRLVQVQEEDPRTFSNFLTKFTPLRLLYRSPEIIKRVTREAIQDAAKDNIHYLELRFSPVALSRVEGFDLAQVMDWVLKSAAEAALEFNITTNLLGTINRHEEIDLAVEVIQLASERCGDGIVGIDLAGNEADCSSMQFKSILQHARRSGLHLSIHAGEWGPGDNVRYALEHLEADRIGHGIRVIESPRGIALAREKNTAFEVCPTSNFQSGAVANMDSHPLPQMLAHGLNITINTDDPGISQINLSGEYQLVCESFGISSSQLCEMNIAAARAAFIPHTEREILAAEIRAEFIRTAGIEAE